MSEMYIAISEKGRRGQCSVDNCTVIHNDLWFKNGIMVCGIVRTLQWILFRYDVRNVHWHLEKLSISHCSFDKFLCVYVLVRRCYCPNELLSKCGRVMLPDIRGTGKVEHPACTNSSTYLQRSGCKLFLLLPVRGDWNTHLQTSLASVEVEGQHPYINSMVSKEKTKLSQTSTAN